jgi:hypothetical protein
VAQCRSLVRDGVHGEEWTLDRSRRSDKLEAVVVRLCGGGCGVCDGGAMHRAGEGARRPRAGLGHGLMADF